MGIEIRDDVIAIIAEKAAIAPEDVEVIDRWYEMKKDHAVFVLQDGTHIEVPGRMMDEW